MVPIDHVYHEFKFWPKVYIFWDGSNQNKKGKIFLLVSSGRTIETSSSLLKWLLTGPSQKMNSSKIFDSVPWISLLLVNNNGIIPSYS